MARAELRGIPAAPGVAFGPLVRLDARPHAGRAAADPDTEATALNVAIADGVGELVSLAASVSADAAEIIEFQIAMLEDEALRAPALDAIARGMAADVAWMQALAAQIADYESAEDATFRARAADLRDLADRVLRRLAGDAEGVTVPPGAIVFADDITPSRFLAIEWRGGGIALAAGSPASHVAMLARARGVPMVVGLGEVPHDVSDVALDGRAGMLLLAPDAQDRARLAANDRAEDATTSHGPARTASGKRVALLLNIAHADELAALDPASCDGIGLVRTELLFANGLPDEATQYAQYRRIVGWASGRPVVIRTLDAGGDKPIPGLARGRESNPFLGVRGVRLSLARPDVFSVQLRALVRAAAHGPLKIMLPMVTVPAELATARALLDEAARDTGLPAPPLGMMVEVPAAALALEQFDAAFFSIGSNDLVQYVTASARDIAAVASLADLRHPAVLRLIAEVAAHGRAVGREVSVCGDAAGDPALVPLLLAAGIETLSMAPNAVAAVKRVIAEQA
jgi:phosphotransferase system enzyme I (PtsI)